MSDKEINFDEIMEALSMLEEVTGHQYEIRLKSDQWATLNRQHEGGTEITTFRWEQSGKDAASLGNRILVYITTMVRDHLAKKLVRLEKTYKETQEEIAKTSATLKALTIE